MIWKSQRIIPLCLFVTVTCLVFFFLNGCNHQPQPGDVQDEALRAGRDAGSFPPAADDYFHDMDQNADPKDKAQSKRRIVPPELTPQEIMGRNTWIVWTGGNDRLWDTLSRLSVGNLDLLKTVSSHPKLKASRDNRWSWMGLVNEPCFEKPRGPDPDRFGLWLDHRKQDCPKDPFEDESKYPGVRVGHRGQALPQGKLSQYLPKDGKMPVGSYYGYATGVAGLRLFPNPDFDEKAAKNWDPERYYNDPSYYNSKDLVKPYRVGMSCAFCHLGPNPLKPPADPENPKWENLSSNVGAQYFWIDRIFTFENDPSSFAWQVFHTSRPGSLDTSLVSTDNINNPRSMNAIYQLLPRLIHAKRWGTEKLKGGDENNKQFNDFTQDPLFTQFYDKTSQTVWSPRVLKDGADSVGALGALNRVYMNIGLFSEEWLLHFNALVGGKKVSPIEIAVARKNSVYWKATEQQTMNMALFFLKTTAPHYLKDAPGGDKYVLTGQNDKLTKGKIVFAEYCARCHSSKAPTPAPGLDPGGGCSGAHYLDCWNQYWEWTKTDDYKKKMREIVLKPDFLDDNFLSSELRIPVTLTQTNACSPLATNALEDNIWDNFSSRTYKDLPSVGTIIVQDPVTGKDWGYSMPGGGRGFTRPASLVSLWSTAPFLLNNTVGDLEPGKSSQYGTLANYNPSPSVENRLKSFDDSIAKMLWPEKREKDSELGSKIEGRPSLIDRTTQRSYLRIPAGYLPDELRGFLGLGNRWFPMFFGEGGIQIGPIPKGTPVNLLASLDMEKLRTDPAAVKLLLKVKHDLDSLPTTATDEDARKVLVNLVPELLKYNKCPDFVVNRGHYFGTHLAGEGELTDDQKRNLIEFLKTF